MRDLWRRIFLGLANQAGDYEYWFERVTLDEALNCARVLSDMLAPDNEK